jgi:photosystem II stability/assembly factor-like uncharacterized protein
MAISLSHGGLTTYRSDSPPDEVVVGTVDGVINIRRNNSKEWYIARKSLKGCHISSLVIEHSSGLLFAGLHNGTVCASPDLGRTWEPRGKGLAYGQVYSLNFANLHGKITLYAGTEPAHLFKSEDLGESWNELSSLRAVPSLSHWTFPAPPHEAHVKNITFDPTNAEILYVCVEQGGLLRSEDQGASWQELHGFDDSDDALTRDLQLDVHRLVIRPSDPDKLYISGGDGIYHSPDGGKIWVHLTSREMRIGYPDALLIHPYQEDLMFTAGAVARPSTWRQTRTADSRIARSRDAGSTWEVLHQGLPEHIRGNIEAMTLDAWNSSFSLLAGTTDGEIFLSEDEGDHWTRIAEGLPAVSKGGHYRNLR